MKLDGLLASSFLVGATDGFVPVLSAVRGVIRRVNSQHTCGRRRSTPTHDAAKQPLGRKRPRTWQAIDSADSTTVCGGTTTSLVASSHDRWEPLRLPPRLQETVERLNKEPDLKAKYKLLVELGDAFAITKSAFLPRGNDHTWGNPQKVPGCVSEVYVAVRIVANTALSSLSSGLDADEVVSICGTADARLSRGLVALLALGLEGESPETVLSLRGDDIAAAVGLRAGLTDSRINGLGNVLRVIQEQVRERLHLLSQQEGEIGEEAGLPMTVAGSADDTPEQKASWGPVAGNWFPPPGAKEEVAMLLSGGVDSSVALRLLQDEGYRIRAFYLKIWLEDELSHLGECPWKEDLAYAAAVCEQAGVPLEIVSLQREYWEQVVSYTVREAREGRTPNPDVMCNSRIKFGMFYDHIGRHFRHVATGHYARLERDETSSPSAAAAAAASAAGKGVPEGSNGEARLLLSPDAVKDQTYFLCALNQTQLRKALFPVGAYTKERVRELAEEYDLPTKSRRDSQGICFLGKLKFDDFLRHYLGEAPGRVIDRETSETIGEHRGLWFHTIGQRKGVGPGLNPGYVNLGPWYVSGKDLPSNVLEVTNNRDAIDGPRESFQVEALSWIAGRPPPDLERQGGIMRLHVKTRHGPQMKFCVLRLIPPGIESARPGSSSDVFPGDGVNSLAVANWTRGVVRLETKDSALAPGQYAAFYWGGECLGAGVISDSAGTDGLVKEEGEETATMMVESTEIGESVVAAVAPAPVPASMLLP